METTLDKFGRIVIPKPIRDDLGLKPGTILKIREMDRSILLQPVREDAPLVIKEGVLVYKGSAAEDLTGVVRAHREKRSGELGSKTGK